MYVQATLMFVASFSFLSIGLILLQAEKAGALRHIPTARRFFGEKLV